MKEDIIIQSLSQKFNIESPKHNDFIQQLADVVNFLIQNDFQKLVQVLYQMDISESKLKKMLKTSTDNDAGLIISMLIIEREKEKIISRDQFKRDNNSGEDDEW